MTVSDPDHSEDEERYIIVGVSNRGRLLMVSHTERGDTIRLISARKLTPKEKRASFQNEDKIGLQFYWT